jgi:hypothetical protein
MPLTFALRLPPLSRLAPLALLVLLAAMPARAASDAEVNSRIEDLLGNAGRYETSIRLFQQAVAEGHRQDVAAFVRFPIRVAIGGRRVTIRSAEGFLDRYDEIMTPDIVEAVTGQAYGDLSVSADGIAFGDGQVVIDGICHGHKCRTLVPQVVKIRHAGDQGGQCFKSRCP